jgi:hypothetical protein
LKEKFVHFVGSGFLLVLVYPLWVADKQDQSVLVFAGTADVSERDPDFAVRFSYTQLALKRGQHESLNLRGLRGEGNCEINDNSLR